MFVCDDFLIRKKAMVRHALLFKFSFSTKTGIVFVELLSHSSDCVGEGVIKFVRRTQPQTRSEGAYYLISSVFHPVRK